MSKEAIQKGIDALRSVIAWDIMRNHLIPYRVRDPIHEAIEALATLAEQPAPTITPEHLLALAQTASLELDKVIKAFQMAAPAQQEPVALPCCGYTDASAVKWNPYNQVVQCHNCGQIYSTPQAQPAQQDQGWKANVQKVRDALDPEDWCGDERMIDVLDRALAQKPCCKNMAAGTSCLADPNPNCPMLAAPQPEQRKPLTPREYNLALALVDIKPSVYEAVVRAIEARHNIKEQP